MVNAPEVNQGRGEVKIKMKYCGICGSDLHEYLHGSFPESPFAHEACGEIIALGEGVKDFVVGGRVCSVVPGSFAEIINCPLERAQIKGDETVLVAGCGTVRLMILLGLKAMGVRKIYMSDLLDYRRDTDLESVGNKDINKS